MAEQTPRLGRGRHLQSFPSGWAQPASPPPPVPQACCAFGQAYASGVSLLLAAGYRSSQLLPSAAGRGQAAMGGSLGHGRLIPSVPGDISALLSLELPVCFAFTHLHQ